MSGHKLNPNPIRIFVRTFITPSRYSFSFSLSFRFSCCIGVFYYNISQHIHMPDKILHLSGFGSAFLHLIAGNGAMPLNPRSKRPTCVVFFVLYEFRVVCMLYKRVVCMLYFSSCIFPVVFSLLYEIVFL